MRPKEGDTMTAFYIIFSCTVGSIYAAKFNYPTTNQEVYIMPSGKATFLWKYDVESKENKKEGVARIDCGYVEKSSETRAFQILASKVGPRNVSINKEDPSAEFIGRVTIIPSKANEIKFTISNVTKKDQHDFRCTMLYWEKEIFNLKRPVYSPTISLKVIQVPKIVDCLNKKSYELTEGVPAQFTCKVSGIPIPRLKCLVLGEKEKVLEVYQNENPKDNLVFVIKSPFQSMLTIKCVALQDRGGTVSISKPLRVRGKPTNTSLEVQVTRPSSDRYVVKLKCFSLAYPAITEYSYYKDGSLMKPRKKISYLLLQVGDCLAGSGKYHCEAKNALGTSKSSTKEITIKEKPTLDSGDESRTINLGNSISLTCKTSGCPAPSITWSKVDDTKFKAVGNTLKISKVQFEKLGNYTCHAVNTKGKATKTFTINARYKPLKMSFTSNAHRGRIEAGKQLEMKCTAKSSPKSWFSIFKGDQLLSKTETGEASIPNIACDKDGGNYTCIAENEVGKSPRMSMWVYVEEKPTITVNPVSKTVNISSTVQLKCKAKGCPSPDILWKKKGSNAVIHSGEILQIKKFRKEDASVYTCVANNRVGEAKVEASINLFTESRGRKGNGGTKIVPGTTVALIFLSCVLMWR